MASPKVLACRGVGVCAGFVLAWAALAQAQTANPEEAQRHFHLGEQYFGNEQWALALAEFQSSYDLMAGRPTQPIILYNIARCNEMMGRTRVAIEIFRRYLNESPATAPLRDDAASRISDLEARQRLATVPGDPLSAIVAFSVSAAGLVGFAIFGSLVIAEDAQLSTGCGATRSCSDAELSNLSTFDALADISAAIAAAGAATGLLLWLIFGQDTTAATSHIAAWWSPHTRGVFAGARF